MRNLVRSPVRSKDDAVDIVLAVLCVLLGPALFVILKSQPDTRFLFTGYFFLSGSVLQFITAGLAPLGIIFLRRECAEDYGWQKWGWIRSLAFAVPAVLIMILLNSALEGRWVFVPFQRIEAFQQSLALPFPWNALFGATALLVYGPTEALFVVFMVVKVDWLFGVFHAPETLWSISPGVVIVPLFSALLHFLIAVSGASLARALVEGLVGVFVWHFLIALTFRKTNNIAGSMLIQTLTNGLG